MQLYIKPALAYIKTAGWWQDFTGIGQSNDIKSIGKQISDLAKQFALLYNEQIRIYNPSIKSIMKSVNELISLNQNNLANLSANITKPIYQFISQLQKLSQENAKGIQGLQALAQLSKQIDGSVKALVQQNTSAPAEKPGETPVVAPPMAAGARAGADTDEPESYLRRHLHREDKSNRPILTANMGSAKYILNRA